MYLKLLGWEAFVTKENFYDCYHKQEENYYRLHILNFYMVYNKQLNNSSITFNREKNSENTRGMQSTTKV